MADDPSKEHPQAEAQFKKMQKAQRATEGAQAMSEYKAEQNAERAKTARLKELRLAKEATDKATEIKPVTKKRKALAVKSTRAGAGRE
jgi:hypothetical protein